MGKSAPPAPDYTGAAQAQGQASSDITEQQTVANRPNINTPLGAQTWQMTPQYDPVTGKEVSTWSQNNTLNPTLNASLQGQEQLSLGQTNLAGSLLNREIQQESAPMPDFMSIAGTPDATTHNFDPSRFNQNASDAAMKEFNTYNQPLFQQAQEQMDTQLRNQGLEPGDKAYDDAMKNLTNSQGMQTTAAEQNAILTGSQIGQSEAGMALAGQGQEFGQNVSRAQYQDTAAQQQLAQEMQKRGFTLDQINAILSGNQVSMPTMPSFATAGASTPANLLGAAGMQGQAGLDAFNAQQAGTAGMEQGVGALGLTAAIFF